MSVPPAPVLKKESSSTKDGILVSWIPPNSPVNTFTVAFKAESWWQSSYATVPNTMSEFLISDVPPNSKVQIWVYATNDAGSSAYSDPVSVISARDLGSKGPATPDIIKEIDVGAKELYSVLYTKEFDKYAMERGMVNSVEVLSYEEKEDGIHKRARVTPPIPASIHSLLTNYMGDTALTYEDHSIKHKTKYQIEFQIKNMPMVEQYVDVAEGKLTLVEIDDSHCRLEGFFDFRVSYPVIGYYVAQVVRAQVTKDLTDWPIMAKEFLNQKASA